VDTVYLFTKGRGEEGELNQRWERGSSSQKQGQKIPT